MGTAGGIQGKEPITAISLLIVQRGDLPIAAAERRAL